MDQRGRQAERSEATRSALIAVARRLFSDRGFERTSTVDIATEAGVTRGALYHHFKDKEDLFIGVFEEIEKQLMERAQSAIAAERDLREGIRAGCSEFLDACLEPDVQRIALIDAPAVLGWDEWRKIDEKYALGLITLGIETAMAEGIIEPQPATPLAHMLLAALTEGAMLIARAQDRETTRREVGETISRIITGLERPAQ
jgi:AcrR family transcriptional regulator